MLKGKKGTFIGDIRVWRMLTVGEHGTFKGFDGIQMALNVAKDMDEIRIEQGTYKGSGILTPKNKVWERGIKISGGWNETFEAKNNDRGATVLNGGNGEMRILIIQNSNVSLENLTFNNSASGAVKIIGYVWPVFTNCTFTNNSASADQFLDWRVGGAVWGNGTFTNCTFTNNSAGNGGGAVKGDGTFTNCIFTNNSTEYGGGGAVWGNGTFTNCTFTSNKVSAGNSNGNGGAVWGNGFFTNCTFTSNSVSGGDSKGGAVEGNGTFINCTFTSNSVSGGISSGYGGAVSGNGTFTNCTFTSNSASGNSSGYGGAVNSGSWRYGDPIKGSVIFTNCKFTNNSASGSSNSYGGAVGSSDDGIFISCTFTNNSVSGNGGAVVSGGAFMNCTFYGNKAEKGGGALHGNGSINNCIFYKNTAGGKDNDITTNGNLEIDYSLIAYISGAANYGANNIMGDPKFVNADNGDLHLRPDSPCINTGKILPTFKNASFSKDLDGKPRIVGGKIDMGAYEWQGK